MKSNKITELYFSDVDHPIRYDRREFIKKLGSGIIIIFSLGELSLLDGVKIKMKKQVTLICS